MSESATPIVREAALKGFGEKTQSNIIEGIIRKMQQDRKVTIIMTTHDREQAGRLADHLLMMKDGAISSILNENQK